MKYERYKLTLKVDSYATVGSSYERVTAKKSFLFDNLARLSEFVHDLASASEKELEIKIETVEVEKDKEDSDE